VLLGLGTFDPSVSRLTALLEAQAAGRPLPPLPPPRVLALAIFAQAMTLGVLVTSVATFGEEFGWTGYLLVQLLPLGRWRAALLYGAVWGLWHAPIIAAGFNYPGYPALGVAMMCALTAAFALTQTALRLRSDSVLLTSFFHASVNTQGLGVVPLLVVGASPVLGGVTGVVGIAAFAAVGAALLATTRRGPLDRAAGR
jgi:membrane protease YdiL (CAAX protease family)